MADEKLLTVREVSIILGISEKEVLDLAESGKIPAYKVGGVYLRFKREQILQLKKLHKSASAERESTKYSFKDRLNDFFYFNDFYVMSILLIVLLLVIILRGY